MFEAVQAGVAIPDEPLLERARGGDSAALEELFEKQWLGAYRLARRLLGNEQDALDAVQDAFAKAIAGLGKFSGRSDFSTWLARIVYNASVDFGRSRKRRAHVAFSTLPQELRDPAAHDPESERTEWKELRVILEQALDELTPKLKTTFVLFADGGLSYEEIAELQKIPVGTVMSRIHSARKKLQPLLQKVKDY
jgi:RNA polymerase sigma-70 factor, ECF subfamily